MTAQRLRRFPPEFPFGFITALEPADSDTSWVDRPFLGKPFQESDVANLLGKLLGDHAGPRPLAPRRSLNDLRST